MANSILIVEDDDILADNIRTFLTRGGWEVRVTTSAEDALTYLETEHPDIVLTDQMLPGKSGLELISSLMALDPQAKMIMLTGQGSVQVAVDAMKAGAYDYLAKPVVLAELKIALEKALGVSVMERALQFYQQRQARDSGLESIMGESPEVADLKRKVRQVLDAERAMTGGDPPSVLITGETGTGKELVARALHVDGTRRNGPFVEVNCASIPSNLLESELFGHERGAFTDAKDRRTGLVESADGGTLFLDEIGEVGSAIQAKLLKLLEDKTVRRVGSVRERRVNLRIVSATNRDLEAMVRDGTFRSDLFFRLRIITLQVPPLRARGSDVLLLARCFLDMHGKRYGKRGLVFSADAERALVDYDWPGNVRELRNMLEETVLLTPERVIATDQLTLCRRLSTNAPLHDESAGKGNGAAAPRSGNQSDEEEREQVVQVLARTDWNVSKSAKILGLSRDMLRYRIEKYGLVRTRE